MASGVAPSQHIAWAPSRWGRNIVCVCLHKNDGRETEFVTSKSNTIADVLKHKTPMDLENLHPVIVINQNGELATSNELLGDLPLESDGKLHMTIQEPTARQQRAQAQLPRTQTHWPRTQAQIQEPNWEDHLTSVGLVATRLQKPDGKFRIVAMPVTTTISEVLQYCVSLWQHVSTVVLPNGAVAAPDMSLGRILSPCGILHLFITTCSTGECPTLDENSPSMFLVF
jgi:hypothetical protein